MHVHIYIADHDITFTFTTPLQHFYNRIQLKNIWKHLNNISYMNNFIFLSYACLCFVCDKSSVVVIQ